MSRQISRIALFLLPLAFTACLNLGEGTRPSRYYLLTGLPLSVPEAGTEGSGAGPGIGLRPVELPPHLNRPQIATRNGTSEIRLAEFHQWAEPLEDNIARVLGVNLSVLIPTDRIALFPWLNSAPIDYQVGVEVFRFDGQPGGAVTLIARWTLYGKGGRETLAAARARHVETVDGASYEAMVSAMNRALEALSRDIASAVRETAAKGENSPSR